MKMELLIIFISAFVASIGCADELKLSSTPSEAIIYVRDFGGTVQQKIGKTPYVGNIQDIAANYAKSNFFMISFEKEGYQTQSIALSDLLKSDININVNMEPVQDFIKYKNIDKSVGELFEAQRLIRAQQYDDAISLLKKIEDKEKNLSIIPEMIASAYYIKKDLKASLAYYRKAYKLNPENKDVFTMKTYLEKSLGTENEKN